MTQRSVDPSQSFNQALPSLFLIAFVFFLIFLCRVIFSPLLPTIQAEMGFSHSQAGHLFFFLAVGGGLGLLSNGFVSRILIHRQTIALSVFLCGSALLATSLSEKYVCLALCMVFTGWASGLYLPSGLATVTSAARAKDWGKALAVHDIAPNLSFLLAPLIVESILYFAPWRTVLLVLGTIQILSALVVNVFVRGGTSHGRIPSPKVFVYIVKQPTFWILVFFFGLAIGMGLGLYSMLPLYLISDHQFQRETANQLLAVSRITGLLGTFVSGYFTDRLGAKYTLGLYFVLAAAASALLGLSSGPLLVVAVFIQPLVATCFFPAGLTALSKAFTEEYRSVAVSFIIPVATLFGQGLVPAMLGYLGQQGAFYLGFVIMGCLLIAGMIPLPFLKLIEDTDTDFSVVDLAPAYSFSPTPQKTDIPK